ncbi:MAG: TylF/MycF/NovP-related O-methyltransferase [Thermoplasmata archaeon]
MRLGVDVSPADAAFEPEFLEIFRKCREYSQTSKVRMYALYKAVEYISRSSVPGDFVECGVWKGGSVMLVARSLLALGQTDRRIFLYDTFEGMTRPGEHDAWMKDGKPASPNLSSDPNVGKVGRPASRAPSLEEVRRNVESTGYPADKLVFVKGPVQATVPGVAPTSIALLRLDTDWYESTKHELTWLYPRLVKGGVLIIDDYGHWTGAKRAVDEYFSQRRLELLSRIDWTARILVRTDSERPSPG